MSAPSSAPSASRRPSRRPPERLPGGDGRRPPPPASTFRSLRLPRAPGAWRAAACALATAFVLLLGAGDAEAQRRIELVSNHGDWGVAGNGWPSTTGEAVDHDHAQQFTTGDSPTGYTLTTVSPLIKASGTAPTWTVSIHEDSAGAPGTSLGTLGQEGTPWGTSNPVRHVAPGSGINVDANTKYWVVFDVGTTSSTYRVHVTDSDAEASNDLDGGWSIADSRLERTASATTWSGADTDTDALAIAIYGHAKVVTPPGRPGGKVNGATVKLYFNQYLKHDATPGRFDFWFNSTRGGTFRPVAAPVVYSNTVTIQAANTNTPFKHGETVRLQYTPPSDTANRLQNNHGHFVEAIPRWLDLRNVTPPAIESAAVNGSTLVLTFDGELWEKNVPRASAFTVSRTRGTTTTTVPLAEPNPVAVRGRTVTLSLAEAVRADTVRADMVTVAYTAPDEPGEGAKLKDADNDQLPVPGFTGQSVTNNTPSSAAPEFFNAAVNGNMLTVNFNENLQTGSSHRPLRSAFSVTATPPGGTARTISGSSGDKVAVSSNSVTVLLADAVDRSESVTVSYTPPSMHPLRGIDNNLVASFSDEPATNDTPGTPAPTFESASYAYSVITVNFDGPFTGCADRNAWSFKVDGGTQEWPLSVRCKGRSVDIILDFLSDVPRIESARSLTVSYHRGTARLAARNEPYCSRPRGCRPNSTQLQGTDGSDVASFTDQPVSGLKPRLVSAAVEGATLTLTFDETLKADSRVRHSMFNVTVNGARRYVVTGGSILARGGVAIAGKTVTLTLQSAVAAGDTVKVRYEGGSLRGASGIRVDSFPDQAVTVLTRGDIWSATLTAGSLASQRGCHSGSLGSCTTALTDASFTLGETTYQVTGLINFVRLRELTHSLRFVLDRAIPSGWTLHVGDHQFPVADATLSDSDRAATWDNVSFLWTAGQQVSLRLTGLRSASGDSGGASALSGGERAFVTDVTMASGAGADKTYGEGDTIRVRVDFVDPVEVTGTPRLKIDMDPADWGEKWASYESGSGTGTLLFAHAVVRPNYSSQGVAVLENSLELNGGTIRADGADADLAHAGRDHDADHKVDWQTASDGGESGTDVEDPLSGTEAPVATGNSGPPTVSGVKVVSSPASGSTYLLGETIRIRATFSEAVTVTGSPRLSIDMSPKAWGTKQAAYASGSGTKSLDFAWTVVEPNYSPQGIAVLANSLALNGGTIRSAGGTNAALAHTGRGHDTGHKVDWRPEISVADARANEGAGAKVAFQVSLSRAFTTAAHRVTVDYATSDGTATAGADYTATSGTLTFAAGEKTKTVNVPILDDSHDEGEETFTLTLSNPTGARIGDGVATGTIVNADPAQKAWIARLGRTVAEQVIGAVDARMAAPRSGGNEVMLGGQRIALDAPAGAGDDGDAEAAAAERNLAAWLRHADADRGAGPGLLAGGAGDPEGTNRHALQGRGMTERELLLGSSFSLAAGDARTGSYGLWGRGSVSRFDGREGGLTVDGEVASAFLGADWRRERTTLGLILGHSIGDGGYRSESGRGTVSSTLTGLYPWVRQALGERVSLWGVAGYGEGTLTVTPANADGTSQAAIRTDLELTMGAVGLRGTLVRAPAEGGFELAAKTDAMGVRTRSASVPGLAGASAEVTRLRLGLEGSRPFRFEGGAELRPSVEVGVRQDGGDAETGFGVDLGGGIAWTDPERGLFVDLRGRGLVSHDSKGFREAGLSGSLSWEPRAESGRGPSLTLTQTLGGQASGGADALLERGTLAGLAANDNGADDGGLLSRRRLEVRFGYGFAAFGDRFTSTPELGFGLSEAARDYRLGWRLGLVPGGAGSLDLSLEATRREFANDNFAGAGAEPEHSLMFRGAIHW